MSHRALNLALADKQKEGTMKPDQPRIAQRAATTASILACFLAMGLAFSSASIADEKLGAGEEYHRDFVFGVPSSPTEEWALFSGGRMYDKWWEAIGTEEPKETHPAYPAAGKQKGSATWRCKECHGWDYKGVAGAYAKGSHFTGIKGVDGMTGAEVDKIAALLRAKPHGYTEKQIPNDELQRLALFISKGQYEASTYIDPATKKVKGNADRGKKLFQGICAACHGFDGKALNFGDEKNPEFVGTIAVDNPWEGLHKVVNGEPGAPMPAWRVFEMQNALDVLSYAQTLPQK